jgi:SAM-dependent methyltransferase
MIVMPGKEEFLVLCSVVQPRSGWDFSRQSTLRAPVPFDYMDIVRSHLSENAAVLDVGTGGGEKFLSLASEIASGTGIDIDPEMIRVAEKNRRAEGVTNVEFRLIEQLWQGIDPNAFDLLICRHAPIPFAEAARVLKSGGKLISQQVGHHNLMALQAAFDEDLNLGPTPEKTRTLLQSEGFEIADYQEYDVEFTFQDLESLIFQLVAVAPPLHFDPETHYENVASIVEATSGSQGLVMNEQRHLYVAHQR